MKLTVETIGRLKLPPGIADKTYFDDDLPGFGLRMRATGEHRWVVQYDFGAQRPRKQRHPVQELARRSSGFVGDE